MPKKYFVYIMATKYHGATYIGMTNDLGARIYDHKNGLGSKYVKRFGITRLVYTQSFDDVRDAIETEKRFKKWRREWKWALIEEDNPRWEDLFEFTVW